MGRPFALPETHGRLRGPGVSWGSGRWAMPRKVRGKGSGGAQVCGASSEGTPRPRRAASRGPPRTRLAVGLDIPPPWRGRCQDPDSPRGFGQGLSCRHQRRYRRFRPRALPPAFLAVL